MPRKRTYKLPSVLRLGHGSCVWVQVVSHERMAAVADGDEGAAACWDVDTSTIFVRADMTPRQQWEAYWHELIHAVNDLALAWKGGI